MNRLKFILPFLFFAFAGFYAEAQPFEASPAIRNYFRNPLGIPMKLSANFGELRPDHWHMGLDIRTEAKENVPVYAAAEGYIAHVGIRPNGYGRFIVINHPNGTSTLYAHLNDFNERLESYVTEQQYQQESWAVELDFSKNQFPVTKGDFIAYSGNTGGSQGPHLHFEIIDTRSQKRFNPLLFNFNLDDEVPPTIVTLAMYDRERPLYSQTPVLYPLKNTDSGFIISKNQLINTGLSKVSFAIKAYDRISKGWSEDGIYAAQLSIDDTALIGFVLDNIGFEERVYMNAHIDYRYDQKGGPFLQLLTRLPGNHSTVYSEMDDGVIHLEDTMIHNVQINVKDAHGNISRLTFYIRHDDSLGKTHSGTFISSLSPNTLGLIEKPDFRMRLNENSLYDTVPSHYYRVKKPSMLAYSDVHYVNDSSYPLHGEATISIRPDRSITPDLYDNVMIQRAGTNTFRKAEMKDGWAVARFGDFGGFQVFVDTTGPVINSIGKGDTVNLSSASRIIFTPTDNFGLVKSFRVDIDDQWIRFTNDKSRNWIYKFDERVPYGVHYMTATATDQAGNTTTKSWWFRREPYTPPPPKKSKSKSSSKKKKR